MDELTNQIALPPEVIEAFSSAAATTLRELAQFDAFPIEVSQTATASMHGDSIVATVRLLRTVPGTMALVMSVDVAERLAVRYLPAGVEMSEEIVNDVAGEFANVIAGQAKTILKGTPYHFLLSLPVVSRSYKSKELPSIATTLELESGQIHLHICLSRTTGELPRTRD